jgi:hypothetical protein
VGGSGLFLRDKKFVIAAGAITIELLLVSIDRNAGLNESLPKNFFYRLAPMWYGTTYNFGDGSSVQPIPTYHFPGSMGYLFRFADGKTLLYTGDVNVRAAYVAHKLPRAKGRVRFDAGPRQIDVGIVEAAFIGRDIGRAGDSADSIIERITHSIQCRRHVFLLTPPGDYGLYLFLHLYDRLISKPSRTIDTRLFLDPLILSQIALIEWRMKRKQVGSLDDACCAWLATRSTLGESARVFDFAADPLGNVNELVSRGMRGVFILDDRRAAMPDYCPQSVRKRLESDGLDVLLIGKAATVAAGDESMTASESFGAGPWLLHSSEAELAHYLLAGPQQFGKVYLFHNFPRRLDKFARNLKERGFPGTVTAL